MVRKVNGAEAVNYIYDVGDKLVKLEKDDTTIIASYYYDPFGRRLWKDTGGIRMYYLYSDEGLVAEYDSSGNEIKSYAYLPDSQWSTNPLYQRVHGKYYWYQNDSQGSPQKILDVTGHIVWQGTYDAFGNVNITTVEIENNLRFAGQYFDNETGLYYNWNRYYNPELGRYITADPAQEGLNLYTYAFNNPNAFVDPEGLCALRKIASFGLDLMGLDDDTLQQGKERLDALLNGDWEGFWGTPEDFALALQKWGESGQLDDLVMGMTMPSGGQKITTVLGSKIDTLKYLKKTGYNVLNIKNWTPLKNIKWLNDAIKRMDNFKLVTNPLKHQELMKRIGKFSGYTDLELPHLLDKGFINEGSSMVRYKKFMKTIRMR